MTLNCEDDFRESLVWLSIGIIGGIAFCWILEWNMFAVYICIVLGILLGIDCMIDRIYFGRTIILDDTGCSFVIGNHSAKYDWSEIIVQRVSNNDYLWGNSEIPGEGIILSNKNIQKPKHIGAMTYCRFAHPFCSVFIRFQSDSENHPKTAAKRMYQGFCVDRNELTALVKLAGKLF